ncbi:Type I secretion outer membrane protein, TolC precursor [hydrothermal vent metagenome]|uniref:Type I secretion outer membrane protein, TolC n=1 Tax=hydrothermal vent metagenome TaxID=652676 RepID=A0A3B0RT89_9ZZZZ
MKKTGFWKMKKIHLLATATVATMLISQQLLHAETLKSAMATAYLNNPTLQAQRASLRALDETINQARAGWRPSVIGSGQFGYKNSTTIGTFASSGNRNPRSMTLEVRQPVFKSMQTVNSTSEARNNVNAAREQLTSVEQQILLDSVTAYMGVLRDIAVLELTNNNVAVLKRQLEASEDRFRVGEITRTDVAQSKARLSRSISERIKAEATLIASRAAYRKTVGNSPAGLEQPASLPPMPASEESAQEIAKNSNPRLIAALYTEKAARYNVKKQYGGLGPTVDVVGRLVKSWENFSSFDQSTTKEVLAQLTLPLYQSGSVSSRIRQSRQVENQRRLEALSVERDIEELVRNAWEGYREATARIVSSEDQVTANDIALEGVRQESEVGSRTILNVLDAEQELLDSRVSLVRAQRDQFVAAYTLLSAIGRLTMKELQLDAVPYDPNRNTENIENKFFGWGIGKE